MSFRKLASAIAATCLVGVASNVNALTIAGITVPDGATFSTISLFEGEKLSGPGNNNGAIDGVGEVLFGVGIVNQILDLSNNVVWSNGDNGRRLTIVIDNFIASTIDLSVANQATVLFTGGTVNLYSQPASALIVGTQAAALAAFSAGTEWLNLAGSPLGGFAGPGATNPYTLKSVAVGTNPLLSSANLTGQGFLDVSAGAGLANANFDTNQFGCIVLDGAPCPDVADVRFTSSGQLNPLSGGNEFGFRGTGEIAAAVAVPTPGTLALVGLAILGVGFGSRRRAG